MKKYRVQLTEEEQQELRALVSKGRAAAYKQTHARILLLSNEGCGGGGLKDEEIGRSLAHFKQVGTATVERVRRRCVEEGVAAALGRKEQLNRRPKKLDGQGEAHPVSSTGQALVALACGELCPAGPGGDWPAGVGAGGAVALVSDGAEWIQGFGDFHCPGSARILDFPHAAKYVADLGRGAFGETPALVDEWQREQIRRLKAEGAGRVLPDLRILVQGGESDELSRCLAYLEKRAAQMQYPVFQAQGGPIGSGAVQSANKLVVEARLKGGGMHWARPSVNPMLGLRNIVCGDRWAGEWPRIAGRLRAKLRRGGRPTLRGAGTPPEQGQDPEVGQSRGYSGPEPTPEVPVESPAEVGVSGGREASKPPRRPPANHPWRRAPVGRAR